MRASMGVIGYVHNPARVYSTRLDWLTAPSDLAEAFPNGEFAAYFRQDWVTSLVRETRTNREYSSRTIDTARWTREQVKRQINLATAAAMS